jgi:muramoyltetrapeptide carboxypeptidase
MSHHHHDAPADPAAGSPLPLHLFSPSGAVAPAASLRLAVRRLGARGYDVRVDEAALARHQRFAGDDDTRLAAVHRVARAAPSVAMATRGGFGLTRLLDRLRWKLLARAAARGTRWVGHSDFTALQLGLLAHTGAPSWAGPMAAPDFGRAEAEGGVDDITAECFGEAMRGELEAVGWRAEAGFDGLHARGLLWGGNLSMVCALLGTPHLPSASQIKGGLLFLEDVNEHPYRVERMLLQLRQAGLLQSQRAVLLGDFGRVKPLPLDRGYRLDTVVRELRGRVKTPILTGLPFGHVATKVCLPVGRAAELAVQGRDVLLGW